MTTSIRPNEAKLKELILYLADKCSEDPSFGRVKLNKLLYIIDAFSYGELGQPVTGVDYMKQEQGPVPRRLVPIREELKREGAIAEKEKRIPGVPNPMVRLIPLREAELSLFSAKEIAFIDEMIAMYEKASGSKLSDMTHSWRGWKIARIGDSIPYEAIFLSDEEPTEYERLHADELIAEHGWDVE